MYFKYTFRKLKIGFKMNIETLKCLDLYGLFFPNEDHFSCFWHCWFACKVFRELVPHWLFPVHFSMSIGVGLVQLILGSHIGETLDV